MTDSPSQLILIVDDNPTNLKVLFDVLEVAGFRTLIARSGEDALTKLEVVQPDLILLDVMMPGIDGFETCTRIKATPKVQAIPVLFMTALSDVEDKVKGLSCGAVDYIAKPFQQDEVLARIRIHLELYQLRQQLERKVIERTQKLSLALEDLQRSQQELQQSQLQLVQNEKMSALGNLVAGIAYEINNPIGFIAGNIDHTATYANNLLELVDLYQKVMPEPGEEVLDKLEEIDLPYIREDFPQMVASMREGAARIEHISSSLRIFSRGDVDHKQLFDPHIALESTLLILRHRLKANGNRPEIRVVKNYGALPELQCYPGQINQVLMNLLANAIDALEEVQGDRIREIQITTKFDANRNTTMIQIHDTGIGIPEVIQEKIFEHLFTTKPVGQGTGLGLAIAHQIIVEKHNGRLTCTSCPKEGTTFSIEIPHQ